MNTLLTRAELAKRWNLTLGGINNRITDMAAKGNPVRRGPKIGWYQYYELAEVERAEAIERQRAEEKARARITRVTIEGRSYSFDRALKRFVGAGGLTKKELTELLRANPTRTYLELFGPDYEPPVKVGFYSKRDLALRWEVSVKRIRRWRAENHVPGYLKYEDVRKFELGDRHPKPTVKNTTGKISLRALVARWGVTFEGFSKWRKCNPGVIPSTLIAGSKHFLMKDVEKVEAAGIKPIFGWRNPRPTKSVKIDGVEYYLAVAAERFSKSSGLQPSTIRSRLWERPDCTQQWLTRPLRTPANPKPDIPTKEVKPKVRPSALKDMPEGSLLVDDSPLTLEHAAHYIATRSMRAPIVINRIGYRVSVLHKSQATMGGMEFYRTSPKEVAKKLTA